MTGPFDMPGPADRPDGRRPDRDARPGDHRPGGGPAPDDVVGRDHRPGPGTDTGLDADPAADPAAEVGADLARRLRSGPGTPVGADVGVGAAGNGDAEGGDRSVHLLIARAVARADAEGLVDVAWATTDTPIGPLTLAATPVGVVRIGFGHEDQVVAELAEAVSPRVLHLPARLDAARRQLDEYFAGRRQHFDLPLDRRLSRGYRLRVLEALSETVRYGQVATYKDLARATRNPGAVRAVGTAMATNPIPIVVPCHRIVRSGGALGNYGGGPETKAWLLNLEGARLVP